MKLIDKIPLPNGLTLEIWDGSRKIAADTTKVILKAKMHVPLEPEYFRENEEYELTRKVFGPELVYDYRMERTFVNDAEKEKTISEFLKRFKKTSLEYLSSKKFPAGFARSRYMEIQRNPYKYRNNSRQDS